MHIRTIYKAIYLSMRTKESRYEIYSVTALLIMLDSIQRINSNSYANLKKSKNWSRRRSVSLPARNVHL